MIWGWTNLDMSEIKGSDTIGRPCREVIPMYIYTYIGLYVYIPCVQAYDWKDGTRASS